MGTQSCSRSHCHQVKKNLFHLVTLITFKCFDEVSFFSTEVMSCYYPADGKKILKEERFSTQCPNSPSCSSCPSKGKTAASGPSLGFVVWKYFTFLFRFHGSRSYNVSMCVKLQWNVCLVGDGWSRGASLSHAAAGVLRRGVKLVGCFGGGESQNSRPHHQTLQFCGLSGSAMFTFSLTCRQVLGPYWR